MVMVFDNGFDERLEKNKGTEHKSCLYTEIGGKIYALNEKHKPSDSFDNNKSVKFNTNKIESIEIGGKVYDL